MAPSRPLRGGSPSPPAENPARAGPCPAPMGRQHETEVSFNNRPKSTSTGKRTSRGDSQNPLLRPHGAAYRPPPRRLLVASLRPSRTIPPGEGQETTGRVCVIVHKSQLFTNPWSATTFSLIVPRVRTNSWDKTLPPKIDPCRTMQEIPMKEGCCPAGIRSSRCHTRGRMQSVMSRISPEPCSSGRFRRTEGSTRGCCRCRIRGPSRRSCIRG